MIKKFNQYNESLKDRMIPKSEDELKDSLGDQYDSYKKVYQIFKDDYEGKLFLKTGMGVKSKSYWVVYDIFNHPGHNDWEEGHIGLKVRNIVTGVGDYVYLHHFDDQYYHIDDLENEIKNLEKTKYYLEKTIKTIKKLKEYDKEI
jgi:hypothetical protein